MRKDDRRSADRRRCEHSFRSKHTDHDAYEEPQGFGAMCRCRWIGDVELLLTQALQTSVFEKNMFRCCSGIIRAIVAAGKENQTEIEAAKYRNKTLQGARLTLFFFQAEDGIRDWSVTGVKTCALPIFAFGNLIGTGTTNPQLGAWNMVPGVDQLGANGLDISMTAFQLVLPDGTVVQGGPFTFSEEIGRASGRERVQSAVTAIELDR